MKLPDIEHNLFRPPPADTVDTVSNTGGEQVTVVPEKVREVGQYVYDLAETLRGALQSAARDVDRLTTESWTGDAATEFATGWTDVREGGTAIIDALAVLAEKLGVSAANYEKQESDSTTLLNM